MSKPVFEDLFKFNGRRNRQSYLLLALAQFAAIIVLTFLGFFGVAMLDSFAPVGYLIMLVVAAGYIALMINGWAAASQRIRDFNQSGVWSLLILIPYVGWVVALALFLIPGTDGDNRYGPDQTKPQLST